MRPHPESKLGRLWESRWRSGTWQDARRVGRAALGLRRVVGSLRGRPGRRMVDPFALAYRKGHYAQRPLDLASDVLHWVRCAAERGLYGYAESDLWSLDTYLARILPGMVRGMRDPTGLSHRYFACGDPLHHHTDQEWQDAIALWNARMEEIARGFCAARRLQGTDPDGTWSTREPTGAERRRLLRRFHRGMDLLRDCFFDLWD